MPSWGALMHQNSRMVCRTFGRALDIAEMANELGYGIKLNTVVTSANAHDDMTEIVKKINPTRWKIFQVLKIEGENDGRVEALLVSESDFDRYIGRHVKSTDINLDSSGA